MNATTKKLLSLLVVLVIALTVVPAVVSANSTATVADVEAWITANDAKFNTAEAKDVPDVVMAPCPACSPATNVEWYPWYTAGQLSSMGHVYMAQDIDSAASTNAIQVTADTCLYLNDHTLNSNNRIRVNKGNLNILADKDGKIVRSNSGETLSMFAFGGGKNLYIYGGTYINNNTRLPMIDGWNTSSIYIYGGNFKANGYGLVKMPDTGTFNAYISGGTFDADPTAYVVEGKAAATMEGGWYVAEPGAPAPTEPETEPTTVPTTAPTTAPTTKPSTDKNTATEAPNLLWLWIVLAVVVIGGGVALFVWKKKK